MVSLTSTSTEGTNFTVDVLFSQMNKTLFVRCGASISASSGYAILEYTKNICNNGNI
jgi:hypothetical protein